MHEFSKRFQIWKKSHKVIICCHQVIVGFCGINWKHQKTSHENLETALQRCSYKKVFWKYATNLQEKTHAEMWLLSNCIEIMLWYGCSPVNLLHIFRTPFYKNTSGGLLVKMQHLLLEFARKSRHLRCVKSVPIRSYSGPLRKRYEPE